MEQNEQSNEEKLIPLEGEETSVPQCEEMAVGTQEMEDSKFLGSVFAGDEEEDQDPIFEADAGDDAVGEEVMEIAVEEAEPSADAARSGGKRKRGRPSRAQSMRPPAKKKEEEDVCFICFDGGNLVVCDRRGCPKVYHPACVNRDEAFFRSRGRWNCGWHICSICEKAAHYMCYTCTYSLCKGCIKEAGFLCVRGNKGFCETCYSTVMLVESKEHANEGKVGVDFDDKNSFEYLFKDYWFELKGKLSLTPEELNNAKSPWKGSGASARNEDSSDELYNANDDQGASSDSSSGHRGSTSSRRKVRRRSRATAAESAVQQVDNEGASVPEDTEWASKELLEFVAHMKGGDKSVLSQFDVQALLLEYIKQNNLRDPRRKSQIICDPRLENLFGKARVGHFEMLKLLESHFLIKEASQVVTDVNQGGVVDPDSGQMDADGYGDAATKMSSDKRRKNRKKVEEREPQTNLDDYAAIDVHNISLIYLRRNLMEDLLDDVDKFNETVVASFVRIRISGTGQRQDIYRLVQVVGTTKAAEKYKTGRKTTDFTLEILNLNKTEVITIDSISNQEFTEEECKRLRQSIKCGLISRLTVGDVQEKARVFHAVRVNDWLESEKLRLGHLRDRASEKGRRKELRECVEKLQLLSSPEERRRRLNEVPEIHVDPNMDPDYESADEGESDDKNQDNFSRSREPSSLRKGISPGRGGSTSSNNWGGARKSSTTTWESSRNTRTEGARDKAEVFGSVGDRTKEPSWNQGKDVRQTNTWETPTILSNAAGLEAGVYNNNQPAIEFGQSYGVAPETMTSLPSDTSETEKMWHYKDPSGKIQGPFAMTQLRKWSTTGYFPDDLRIWRASEKQEDSILLADALIGKFEKDLPQWEPPQSNFSQPTTFAAGMDSRANEPEGGWRGNNNPTWADSKQNRGNWIGTVNTELPNADRWTSQSSTWSAPRTEMVNLGEMRSGISPRGWEPSKDTSAWSGQPQARSSPRPTAAISGNPYGPTSYQGSGGRGVGNTGRWNQGQDHRSNWSSNSPRASLPSGQGYDRPHSNWGFSGQQSSRTQWENDSFNLPTTTPQPSSGGWISAQGAMNTPASPTPVQPMGSGWGTPPSTGINGAFPSSATTMEHNKATPVANLLGWDSTSASMPNMGNQMAETNAAQVPQSKDGLGESLTSSQQTDATNVLESHSAVVPRDEVIPSSDPTVLGGSSRNELSVDVGKNQFFASDYPIPTPRSEHELAAVQSNDLDPGKKWPEANDSRGSDPAFAAPALGMLDPPASHPSEDNLKSVSSTSAEDVQNLANSRSLLSEPQDNLSPIRDTEDKLIHAVLSTKPTPEAVSTQSSEGWAPASAQKQDPNDSSHCPAPSGHGWEQNQTQKPEPSLPRPEPMKTINLEGTPDAMRGEEWSLPSPTPSTKPSGWNVGADPTSGSSQNNPWVSSDGSRPPESSQLQAGTPIELAQPCQSGWGTGAKDSPSSGWGVAPQNPNLGARSAQGNPNAGWGSVIQGNTDTGWGTIAQGNANVAWGTPAQGNANLNMGWGTPAAQGSTNPNTGLGMPQQVNPNPNTGWGTPAQGNTNPNTGLGAPSQGNTNPSTRWGTLSQGNTNPNAGWGAATQGETTNPGWGQPTQESSNPNSGWGTAIQQNATWGTGQQNINGWDTQQNQSGGRYRGSHGGDSRHDARYDSRHGGGRNQRNDRMHRDRGGGSFLPPPRGGGQGQGGQRGVCKFHESGYCKKGASCNYLHT